ncbi:MAG: hypothetical protein MZV64_59590 [Ignavibacteriales bacterium]|nr:hypothetical protein [Ignavibacteriales bacterium]
MITIHDVDQPASAATSRRSTTKQHKDWDVIAVKGAPDMVLNLCTHYQAHGRHSRAAGRGACASASWRPTTP